MKKKKEEIATIKLIAPKGETMFWETDIKHVNGKKVKDLEVAKKNFAHLLVNKQWLEKGLAEEIAVDGIKTIRPLYKNADDFWKKKLMMQKEVKELASKIKAFRVPNRDKKKKKEW